MATAAGQQLLRAFDDPGGLPRMEIAIVDRCARLRSWGVAIVVGLIVAIGAPDWGIRFAVIFLFPRKS